MKDEKAIYDQFKIAQLIMNNTQEIIWAVDHNYCLLFANKAYQTALKAAGGSEMSVGVKVLSDEYPKEFLDFWKRNYEKCFNNETFDIVSSFPMFDGLHYIENLFSPLKDENGINCGAIVISHDITEKKKFEIELKDAKEKIEESESRLRNYFQLGLLGMAITSINKEWIEVNQTICNFLDYTKEELLQKTWIELTHPEDLDIDNNLFDRVMKGEIDEYKLDKRFIGKNGNTIYTELAVHCLRDSDKNVKCFLALINDITDRKLAVEAVLNSETKYKNLVRDAQVGLLIQGPNTEMLLNNNKALELLGITEEQLLGKTSFDPYWNVIHEDGSAFPSSTHPIVQAIETRKSVENVVMGVFRPTIGDRIWLLVSATPQLNQNGEVEQAICSFIDISELKIAERQLIIEKEKVEASEANLRLKKEEYELINEELLQTNYELTLTKEKIEESERLLKKIAENYPNSFISIVEKDLSIGYSAGQEFTRLKLNPKNYVGLTLEQVFGEHAAVVKQYYLQTFAGKETSFELFINNQYQLYKTVPIFDEKNKISRILSVVENITQRKQNESDLIKAKEKAEESDRLKSAFLANMSHEIRTPMSGILGFTKLLKKETLNNEKHQEFIKIIEKSGDRMLKIINDIIDLSKIEAGLMEVNISKTNVNEEIENIYSFFKPEVVGKGMQLALKNSLSAKESIILTDKEKLDAILTNLIKNATKYSHKGTIEIGYILKPSNLINKSFELEFFVKDTGIGIPIERQHVIFDRFIQVDISNRTSYQGAGLGLSISKAYVELLGGKIWVESEEGKGSAFRFTIPYNNYVEETIALEKTISSDEKMKQLEKLKILIAEDDDGLLLLLSEEVEQYSSELLIARNGEEAVEICRMNPDIDLILMDTRMPLMDGNEATLEIRQFNKEVIIFSQTANVMEEDKEMAISAGSDDYLEKPIDEKILLALILKHFGKDKKNSQ